MKSIENILNNYSEYETFLEDRFGRRFCEFLTPEQMEKIGFRLNEERKDNWKTKEWTYENVLLQLKEDAEFGLEKAEGERDVSSSLMYEMCKSWCKIIEREDLIEEYDNYGIDTFENIIRFVEGEI